MPGRHSNRSSPGFTTPSAGCVRRTGTISTPGCTSPRSRRAYPAFTALVGPGLLAKMNVIRTLGNHAVHGHRAVPVRDAVTALRELFHVAYWLGWTYSRDPDSRPAARLRFDEGMLPVPET